MKPPPLAKSPGATAEWLPNFVLTSILRVNVTDPQRQLIFNFIRRTDSAVLEYSRAREELAIYFDKTGGRVTHYFRGLHAFESAVAMTYQAHLLLSHLFPDKPSLFAKKDGTVLQRLDRVYNASKHLDLYIANGARYAKESTLTVWLVNTGVQCAEAFITFAELASAIDNISRIATALADGFEL